MPTRSSKRCDTTPTVDPNRKVPKRRRVANTKQDEQPIAKKYPPSPKRDVLSDDILGTIFREVFALVVAESNSNDRENDSSLAQWRTYGPAAMQQLIALSEVSQQWKRVAYERGTLPARVLDPRVRQDRFDEFLCLSETASLVVDLEPYLRTLIDDEIPNEQFKTLLRQIHRMKGLNFVAVDNEAERSIPPLMEALRTPAPHLEVLVVRNILSGGNLAASRILSTFHPGDDFLGGCTSSLRHLILEDVIVVPSLTNPGFRHLVSLKMESRTLRMSVDTILPWLKLANRLASLQRLSFKGLARSNNVSIRSKLGTFTLPCGLKKLTIGGDVEPCTVVLKCIAIPLTCSVRVLAGAHWGSDLVTVSPDVIEECASQCSQLWQSDPDDTPFTALELVTTSVGGRRTRLLGYLGVSCTSPGRRIDIRFAALHRSHTPFLVRAFVDHLRRDGPLTLDCGCWLKLRLSLPSWSLDLEPSYQYPEIARDLLRQWSSVRNVDIASYNNHPKDGQWADVLGILPSFSGADYILNEATEFRIYRPLLSAKPLLTLIIERDQKKVPGTGKKWSLYDVRDDTKFTSDPNERATLWDPKPKNKHFLDLY